MTKSVLWTSCSRLSCSGLQSPLVVICVNDPTILATVFCFGGETSFQPTTLSATLIKVWKDGSQCGAGMWRYLFSYNENVLTDPNSTLKASDVMGVFCEGCLTSYINDAVNLAQCPEPAATCQPYVEASKFGNDSAAINEALSLSKNVILGPCDWHLESEILTTRNNTFITCNGANFVLENSNINIFHWCASYGGILGNFTVDQNGKTGISGYRVTPQSESQTTVAVNQIANLFSAKANFGTIDEAIVMQAGPTVSGTASGSYYNAFENVYTIGTKRSTWLKDGVAGSVGNNRNLFLNCRFGGSGSSVGYQIDSGDTNRVIKCDFEGISATTVNNPPYAIIVKQAGAFSGDNNNNSFEQFTIEGCTKDILNANAYTRFVGDYDWSKCTMTARPRFNWGADNSLEPFIFGDTFDVQQGGQIAHSVNGPNFRRDKIAKHFTRSAGVIIGGTQVLSADYDDSLDIAYLPTAWVLTTTNVTNVNTFAQKTAYYEGDNGIFHFSGRFQFRALVNTTDVKITLPPATNPVLPDAVFYTDASTCGPMNWGAWVNSGFGGQWVQMELTPTGTVPMALIIHHPTTGGGWDVGGNNANISFDVWYKYK